MTLRKLPEGDTRATQVRGASTGAGQSDVAQQVDFLPTSIPASPSESSLRWPVTSTDGRENPDVGVEPKGPSPQERHGVRSAEGARTLSYEERLTLKRMVSERRHKVAVRQTNGCCSGCGCPWDEFTVNCGNCIDRRSRRRIKATRMNLCVDCGCELDNNTRGCQACWDRHRRRRERHSDRSTPICSGCGVDYDEWTRGCPRCAKRHDSRRRRSRERSAA